MTYTYMHAYIYVYDVYLTCIYVYLSTHLAIYLSIHVTCSRRSRPERRAARWTFTTGHGTCTSCSGLPSSHVYIGVFPSAFLQLEYQLPRSKSSTICHDIVHYIECYVCVCHCLAICISVCLSVSPCLRVSVSLCLCDCVCLAVCCVCMAPVA